jgi:hypothetical protein
VIALGLVLATTVVLVIVRVVIAPWVGGKRS